MVRKKVEKRKRERKKGRKGGKKKNKEKGKGKRKLLGHRANELIFSHLVPPTDSGRRLQLNFTLPDSRWQARKFSAEIRAGRQGKVNG